MRAQSGALPCSEAGYTLFALLAGAGERGGIGVRELLVGYRECSLIKRVLTDQKAGGSKGGRQSALLDLEAGLWALGLGSQSLD